MDFYVPDNGSVALQQSDTFVVYLSQRDLSLQIPVNYVTYPGVVLSAACFPHGRYDDVAFGKCLSNLLAVGFRRLEADIFWDPSRNVWSLCPVELGDADEILTTSISTATSSRRTETQLASNMLTEREFSATRRDDSTTSLVQATQSPQSSRTTESASTTITIDSNSEPVAIAAPTAVVQSTDAMVDVGPYLCSPNADFQLLMSILSDYMTTTELNVNATTVMLSLNLHAAASASDPTGPAEAPADDDLPGNDKSLSNIIANNASVYLYTMNNLLDQRTSLNTSRGWFAVGEGAQPDASYFTVDTNSGIVSTPNGWPSESYIEIQNGKRLIVEYGDVDPQMSNYNFSADAGTIFPQNFISKEQSVTVDSAGNITSGCFFQADPSLSSTNSSWATTSLANGSIITGSSLTSILTQARNLTACGISPILNGTLNNFTADQNFSIYETYVNTTIWSWETPSQQPINSSSSDEYANFNCAVLNATSGYWQAAECSSSHYGACRYQDQPYSWNITNAHAPYINVDLGCSDSSSFSVPRTALENTYLLSTWRQWLRDTDDDDAGVLLWLDFNDLDIEGCWTIGQNGTCPWTDSTDSDTREVVVPVVAGIIVGIIVILTILVKCAGNRQATNRRRKRASDGWDYECVPS